MQGVLNSFIEASILIYQRNISPKKNYCCAHNSLNRSGSCSNWALGVLRTEGLRKMILGFIPRFYECWIASQKMAEKNEEDQEEEENGKQVASCCINLFPWT